MKEGIRRINSNRKYNKNEPLKSFFKGFTYFERERKGEREGEKHRCVRDTSIGGLSQAPNW